MLRVLPGASWRFVALHEHQLLEQRARPARSSAARHAAAGSPAWSSALLQRLQRDVLGQQQLEPVEQFARWRASSSGPGTLRIVVEGLQRLAEQLLLEPGIVHVDDGCCIVSASGNLM
jgi:hypothetical protein